ncbi:hypothetical protein HanIR_Chr15g0766831 [Helianthus annuus]|nr:hypothetical protein HanIR_Chr15g0766831 [Helianthus annuus]
MWSLVSSCLGLIKRMPTALDQWCVCCIDAARYARLLNLLRSSLIKSRTSQ